jgi:hypothetical protein
MNQEAEDIILLSKTLASMISLAIGAEGGQIYDQCFYKLGFKIFCPFNKKYQDFYFFTHVYLGTTGTNFRTVQYVKKCDNCCAFCQKIDS